MSSIAHGSQRPNDARIPVPRRTALGILSSLALFGCDRSESVPEERSSTPAPSNVPLRIVFDGGTDDAERIRRAYGAAAEQPIEVSSVDSAKSDQISAIVQQVQLSDVAVVSQALLGRLINDEAIVDINDDVFDEIDSRYGRSFSAIENSSGRFDGLRWGVAVGAKPLAVLSLDPDLELKTWADHAQWAADLNGKTAEPLAEGWAAHSFFNRCALQFDRGWLFDRLTLKPSIDQPRYIDALQGLVDTAKVYASTEMTPGGIYNQIRNGVLQGGIGFVAPPTESLSDGDAAKEVFDISATACPNETETERVWLGPQTRLACVSTGCRQTEASRRFIGWLSGGAPQSGALRQTVAIGVTREPIESQQATGGGNGYDRWVVDQLKTSRVVPGPWIPGGMRYYDVLDQEVRSCLASERTPAQALKNVADAWSQITEKLGRDKQLVAWKKLDV
ncbi:extracellular solute-binding protein [Roseiconus lacunae]|uniref:extracellular solute-binding protein n=1 Tax=Roseiconus lacunae TaxID=2605694 RepID=UPI0011F2D8B8|nr:extracellular solute-binding protein [Roseiconus lacunae]